MCSGKFSYAMLSPTTPEGTRKTGKCTVARQQLSKPAGRHSDFVTDPRTVSRCQRQFMDCMRRWRTYTWFFLMSPSPRSSLGTAGRCAWRFAPFGGSSRDGAEPVLWYQRFGRIPEPPDYRCEGKLRKPLSSLPRSLGRGP